MSNFLGGDTPGGNTNPNEGYVVADVIVNGESIGAVESYTIDGWQGYVKLTAVFEAADDGE